MGTRFILSEYAQQAMAQAVYDKLEDGSFVGRIPACQGVIAFGSTLREFEDELRSALEDWIGVGLKLEHPLPVVGGIDINLEDLHDLAVVAERRDEEPISLEEMKRRLREDGLS